MSRSATSMAQSPGGRSVITRAPFRELLDLQHSINSLFGDACGTSPRETSAVASWTPLVDVFQDENAYTIKLELPEIRREDVKVTLDKDVLSISGERHLEHADRKDNYHRVERSYGQFFRSFTLPPNANPEAISAEFKDGVLKLSIPKKEEAKPKQIQVDVK